MIGIGSYESTTTVTLKQNVFFAGDSIKVSIHNDNSKNKHSIKNFKFKLARDITTRNSSTGALKAHKVYIFEHKEKGVDAYKSL